MSTRLTGNDDQLRQQFESLRSASDVATLLEITPAQLHYYAWHPANYKTFYLRKKSGGKRLVMAPANALKIIQQKLNQALHAVYRGRSPVHGFARGKSIVTNARMHLGHQYLLNIDLQDFFPSINFGRVMGLFEARPYALPRNVAVLLARLCCHNQVLPAGAPTSPVVANMICGQMDSQLKRFAIGCGCVYTRYADDITISVRHGRFPPVVAYRDPALRQWVVGKDVLDIISSNGFSVNHTKTRILPRGWRQEVTGIAVAQRLNVRRGLVRQVRAMLHAAEKWGIGNAEAEFRKNYDRKARLKRPVSFLRVLRGKIEFIGLVRGRDDGIYGHLLNRYLKVDAAARSRPIFLTMAATQQVIERAVWLLEEPNGPKQGTGFALAGIGLVTAAHVLAPDTEALCRRLSSARYRVNILRSDAHVDVASASIGATFPVQFKIGRSEALKHGDSVKVLGFPLHRDGNTVNVEIARITGFSAWHAVPHWIVSCPIVRGASGGPVLNEVNEVVGIAVKGQGIPKRFGDDDEMSRFVPIHFALSYLR